MGAFFLFEHKTIAIALMRRRSFRLVGRTRRFVLGVHVYCSAHQKASSRVQYAVYFKRQGGKYPLELGASSKRGTQCLLSFLSCFPIGWSPVTWETLPLTVCIRQGFFKACFKRTDCLSLPLQLGRSQPKI